MEPQNYREAIYRNEGKSAAPVSPVATHISTGPIAIAPEASPTLDGGPFGFPIRADFTRVRFSCPMVS
jgi:hypothetical protein